MKHVLLITAALTFGTPGVVLAATSGSIEGQMTIPYACSITVPGIKSLTESGASASATDAWTFIQNDRTVYSMTPVTIANKPDNATVTGSITLQYGGGSGGGAASAFIFTADETNSAIADVPGNLGNTQSGSVIYSLVETVRPRFYAGDYQMSTVLTCAQATSSDGAALIYAGATNFGNALGNTDIRASGEGSVLFDSLGSSNPLDSEQGVYQAAIGTSDSDQPGYTMYFRTEEQRESFQTRLAGIEIYGGSSLNQDIDLSEVQITASGTTLNVNTTDGRLNDSLYGTVLTEPFASVGLGTLMTE